MMTSKMSRADPIPADDLPYRDEVIAHALVEAADHEPLAASRWGMQGASDAPRYIQSYRSHR